MESSYGWFVTMGQSSRIFFVRICHKSLCLLTLISCISEQDDQNMVRFDVL